MSGSAVTPPRIAGTSVAPVALAGRAWVRAAPAGAAACVALAALSLLAPTAPTYDPWAWIVWGREILHLDLSTVDGPSWKPLPVAFTTAFALLGDAAPDLWVLVARAGALYGALSAFRLGRRLGGTPAGAAAAVGLLLAPWFVRNGALGNSEGLQVAFALAAVDRLLEGRRRTAFALALALGMLRPEAWAFLGLLGLWLAWRDRGARWLVGLGLASLPLLWLLPEQLGSGDWLRASHRAQQPVSSSPAFSENPVVEVLREGAAMLTPPVWAGIGLLATVALWRRDARVALLGATAAAWTLLVALMTAGGYSGNERYLIVPAAATIVLAAVGASWAASALLAGPLARGGAAATALLALALGVAFGLPPAHRVRAVLHGVGYQARLLDELGPVVERAGGAERLRACGHAYTGAYLVPAVAWHLGVHTTQVGHRDLRPPAVVFRVRTQSTTNPVPSIRGLGPAHAVVETDRWRVLTACA